MYYWRKELTYNNLKCYQDTLLTSSLSCVTDDTMETDDFKRINKETICDPNNTNNRTRNKNVIITRKEIGTDYNYKHQIVWKNAIGLLILHILGIWGLKIYCTGGIHLLSYVWIGVLIFTGGTGVAVGAHRLFCHRCFKATPLLKAFLILFQTSAGQNCLYIWCRDHRLHHRYSETDADPHNSKRGFFFSHVGWLMMKKHPYVKEMGKRIDMSDLEADWMVMFQKKYYFVMYIFIGVFIPVFVPYYYFQEPFYNSLLVCYFVQYVLLLNGTWTINSLAHLYGTRPYDKKLQAVESWFLSILTNGEGWHNYHHAFPWDYKAAELGTHLNISARVIRIFEKLGLAYDLKTASQEMVVNRIKTSGDGTHYALGNDEAKSLVTALGPVHPLNPTYNVKYKVPDLKLQDEGFPLFHKTDVMSSTVRRKNATV